MILCLCGSFREAISLHTLYQVFP